MNYGLYLSAAGALTSMHRLDVVANNLANVNTIAFKPDLVTTRARLPERLEDPQHPDAARHLLEDLGGGLFIKESSVQFRQGSFVTTDDDLDLAIEGKGFFVVADPRAANGESLALTRDGRLTLDRGGMLVNATTGRAVLDIDDQPIRLSGAGKVTVLRDGEVLQDGQPVATINLVEPAARTKLIKAGENMFQFTKVDLDAARPASGSVLQGAVESSAVDPVIELKNLIAASKAVQGNLKLMQYHDQLMGQAINTFGRVA